MTGQPPRRVTFWPHLSDETTGRSFGQLLRHQILAIWENHENISSDSWVFCIFTGIFYPYRCFQKIGIPQNGWFTMENPIKMDDLGVPLFLETPIYIWLIFGGKSRGKYTIQGDPSGYTPSMQEVSKNGFAFPGWNRWKISCRTRERPSEKACGFGWCCVLAVAHMPACFATSFATKVNQINQFI